MGEGELALTSVRASTPFLPTPAKALREDEEDGVAAGHTTIELELALTGRRLPAPGAEVVGD